MDFVPVYVPVEHHPAVLGYLTSLVAATSETQEWSDDLLKRLYVDSAESTISVLVALAEKRGTWVTTKELAEELFPNSDWRSVAGALGPITKRQKAYGLSRWPFDLRQDPETGRWAYRMNERTAEIILREHRFVQDVIDEITRENDSK
jgi:hypothetical protein